MPQLQAHSNFAAKPCKAVPGSFTPVIDRNRCEGKGPCVTACPYDVLEIKHLSRDERRQLTLLGSLKAWAHGYQQASATGVDRCMACGDCVRVCPEQAITLARRHSAVIGAST